MPFSESHGGADTVAPAVCYSDSCPYSSTHSGADPLSDAGAHPEAESATDAFAV